MLNLFFARSKTQTHLQKIKDLEQQVEKLSAQVDTLSDSLSRTQGVLVQVAKAQFDFVLEFEALIRSAIVSLDTPCVVVKPEKDPDAWN